MAVWQCTVYHLVTAPSAWGAVHRALQLRCVLTWLWITYTSYSAVRESLGPLGLPATKEGRHFSGPPKATPMGGKRARKNARKIPTRQLWRYQPKRSQNGTEKGGRKRPGTPF